MLNGTNDQIVTVPAKKMYYVLSMHFPSFFFLLGPFLRWSNKICSDIMFNTKTNYEKQIMCFITDNVALQ